MPPDIGEGIVLKEQMVVAEGEDKAAGIVGPIRLRREMELRTVAFVIVLGGKRRDTKQGSENRGFKKKALNRRY